MRIFFLGNNWVGWQVLKWLKEQNEQIVGLAIHPPRKRKYGDEIIQNAQVSPEHIFDGTQLHQPKVLEGIKGLHSDIGLSVFLVTSCGQNFLPCFPMALSIYTRRTYPTTEVPIPMCGVFWMEHQLA